MLFKKKPLAVAITVYWILLAYIISLLAWWFIDLERQNRQMTSYKLQLLQPADPHFADRVASILSEEKKKTAADVGEGSTFLLVILVGAIYVYREVRRQIRLQLQQQNFMMALTHELKTPIAVTKLNLETLRKHKLDEQRQQKMIQAALQETDRLDVLANNILIASQRRLCPVEGAARSIAAGGNLDAGFPASFPGPALGAAHRARLYDIGRSHPPAAAGEQPG
jgi:two-component system, OmpR family, sensor histidine kinase CiaH